MALGLVAFGPAWASSLIAYELTLTPDTVMGDPFGVVTLGQSGGPFTATLVVDDDFVDGAGNFGAAAVNDFSLTIGSASWTESDISPPPPVEGTLTDGDLTVLVLGAFSLPANQLLLELFIAADLTGWSTIDTDSGDLIMGSGEASISATLIPVPGSLTMLLSALTGVVLLAALRGPGLREFIPA